MELTFTKNFWTCVHTYLFGTSGTVGDSLNYCQGFNGNNVSQNTSSLRTIGTFKDITGTQQSLVGGIILPSSIIIAQYMAPVAFDQRSGQLGTLFAIGSGTTAPTENDYVVETPINDATITVTGQNSANGSCTFHVVVTATASITVSEICMLKRLTTAARNGTDYTVLIGRAVLDTPVALANGESKTFDVTISLPVPTA